MNYGIILGSNLLIDTQGILKVFENGKQREFFRVRELHRIRSEGSYLVLYWFSVKWTNAFHD